MFKGILLGLAALVSSYQLALSAPISGHSVYVIDGDTIDYNDQRFRLVGFDTPETYRHKCDYELALGNAATERVRTLLTGGGRIDLAILPGLDRYGRGLARLYVDDRNLADILVSEGLARRYDGGRREGWC